MGKVYFNDYVYDYHNGDISHRDTRLGYCKFINDKTEVFSYDYDGYNMLPSTPTVGYVKQNGDIIDSHGYIIARVYFDWHEIRSPSGSQMGYYYPDDSNNYIEGLYAGAAILLGLNENKINLEKEAAEKEQKKQKESSESRYYTSSSDANFILFILLVIIAAIIIFYKFMSPFIKEHSFELMFAINVLVCLLIIVKAKDCIISKLIIFLTSSALGTYSLIYIHDLPLMKSIENWIKSITDSSLLSILLLMSPFFIASLICIIALISSDGDENNHVYATIVLCANGALFAFSSAHEFFVSETIFGKTIGALLVFAIACALIAVMCFPFIVYTATQ